jgi:uncharacterized protein YecT (DUF1311 family)
LFLSGVVVGAALATALAFFLREPAGTEQVAPVQRQAVQKLPDSVACPSSPVVVAAPGTDGRASFEGTTNASASIVKGKEAAAAGLDRDAEAAFLAACKVPVPAGDEKANLLRADAMYNLARHYASLAEEGASHRDELLKRASTLLEHSLAVYQSQLGQSNEKVKFALQAIAAIREEPKQAAAQEERVAAVSRPEQPEAGKAAPPTPPAKPAIVARPRAAAAPAPAPTPTPVAVAPAPAPVESARARPSFNCAKARSTPERLICSDDELARQDSELNQIYARAKGQAADPAAFQRVSDREWRRRETECRTRECLLDWYAQRRRQLLGQQ